VGLLQGALGRLDVELHKAKVDLEVHHGVVDELHLHVWSA
jgi:hypothetical protein